MRRNIPYPKICLSLMARSTPEMLQRMEVGFKETDMLELRIDGLPKVDLKKLLAYRKGELLITNRVREEGGAFSGSEEERVGLLMEAVARGVGYVDLEAGTKSRFLEKVKNRIEALKGQTRLVLSSHYFEGTPSLQVLRKKIEEGKAAGADFIKIVPYALKMEDNLKVIGLIPYAQKKQIHLITFCMGEMGKISRLLAPLCGSCWTYASLTQEEASAPGQMTIREMRKIYRLII
ncbi:MAG: type I 3-dehydroquinate dehydratase [Syntrophales bacterium LBB04]|nr:type I 3-dehydroquinate dehydratase [Syntrophales bacterium LBB04]